MRDDPELISRLRGRDEEAFRELVRRHHGALLRLAGTFVRSPATAEEVVQETWLAVLQGLDGFEARSSLKTWIFSILANRARSRAVRDGRMVLFSEIGEEETGDPAVDPSRFAPSGSWREPPQPWGLNSPEGLAASAQLVEHVRKAIDELPAAQRAVVLLRDVEGCTAEEACNVLGVSETNQRVLLHRGRSRVRKALELLLAHPKRRRG
jgi:RNA polymerase sigma-70 factor (ECF subfamily)